MKIELTDAEVPVVLEAIQARKGKADRRKGYGRPDEAAISMTLAPVIAQIKGLPSPATVAFRPVIVDFAPSDKEAREKDKIELQERWNAPTQCLYGCGVMKQINDHNKVCQECGFHQWSNLRFTGT